MVVEDERRRLGSAFAEGGAAYARLRPSYPREAVAWMIAEAPPGVVADVGAGTGKLTRLLVDLGRDVVAVEPSTDMAMQLRDGLPAVDVRVGSGESTGLDDASAAAVCYGQAWHWVEPGQGTTEAARVLRPGGVLGLVWNYMDTGDSRVDAVNRAMHVLDPGVLDKSESAGDVGAPFGHHENREFRWAWSMTTSDLAELVTTRSYYLARPEPERAEIRRAVTAAVEQHFGPAGANVELPQVTSVHRFLRP